MSYSITTNFYLIDNYLFDKNISNLEGYLVKPNKKHGDAYGYSCDFCIFSAYGRSLHHKYCDILSRSPPPKNLLSFLICDAEYSPQYFIIKPCELNQLINELDILINWMTQDEYCLEHLFYTLSKEDMFAILKGNFSDEYEHKESIYYPYYCLIVLKDVVLTALTNQQFFVVKIYVC